MFVLLLAAGAIALQNPDSMLVRDFGIRNPAFSPHGRLAFELEGDIWVADLDFELLGNGDGSEDPLDPSSGQTFRITSGPDWDMQPVWHYDGERLVFASNREGKIGLWTVTVGASGPTDSPTSLTDGLEAETDPSVDRHGSIVYCRGSAGGSDLWIFDSEGNQRRITRTPGIVEDPAVSPDGHWVAYVAVSGRNRELRRVHLPSQSDELIVADIQAEHPSWHPNGDYLTFTTRTGDRGVWLIPVDGSYVNLVSRQPSTTTFSADGRWLLLASLPRSDVGYNGDPIRLEIVPEREAVLSEGKLYALPAPAPAAGDLTNLAVEASSNRQDQLAERFDRFWNRVAGAYRQSDDLTAWEELGAEYRPRAIRATSVSEFEELLHEMGTRRPHLRPEVRGNAAVSSAHTLASEAGADMLARGGNVVDAAVATSFAIGVVEPDASGIGGYGEMVLYLRGMDAPTVIEFLTRVPEQAGLGNADILVDGRLPRDGPVLANIPGTVGGMWKAWEKYGSGMLEWSDLLQPAIRLAEEGFVLDESFTTTLQVERFRFANYESSLNLFFPDGNPLQPGDTLRNPDLAWTLRQIANGGADAFYRGEIARRMVADLRGQGNAMTLHDLARYFPVEREPITGTYHDHTIYSAAPAAGGGVSLVTKLNLLDAFPAGGLHSESASSLHAMIEAWKLAPTTAGRLADPSLWPVDLDPILDPDRARRRWQRCFQSDRATGPTDLVRARDGRLDCEDGGEIGSSWGESLRECVSGNEPWCSSTGTTAFTVADSEGSIVAVTQTLGTWGGNFYVTPGLGFLYNDKLRSYRTDPSSYGARLPYARHGTSIAPTIVFEGTGADQTPKFAVAAAGNAWITSAVYQMTVSMIDQGLGPQDALELPRFLTGVRRDGHQVREIVVQMEGGVAPSVLRELSRMGHDIQLISLPGELRMGYGAAVRLDDGQVRAGGDPRRSGGAVAISW